MVEDPFRFRTCYTCKHLSKQRGEDPCCQCQQCYGSPDWEISDEHEEKWEQQRLENKGW